MNVSAMTTSSADSPKDEPLPAYSAARAVYETPNILEQIIDLLPFDDMKSVMRVGKSTMVLAARRIYGWMTFQDAQLLLAKESAYRKIYAAAVRHINASRDIETFYDPPPFSPTTIRGYGIDPDKRGWKPSNNPFDGVEQYAYHPDILSCMLEHLLLDFPNLQGIGFYLSRESWDVHIDSKSVTKEPSSSLLSPGTGRIVFKRRYTVHPSSEAPYDEIHPPPAPPLGYKIQYNLTLCVVYSLEASQNNERGMRAVSALKDTPYIEHVSAIELADLPIPLGSLGDIYKRQAAFDSGKDDRLCEIEGKGVTPFDIHDFRSFAMLASSSLSHLCLGRRGFALRQERAGMSFGDLPSLIEIIRDNLPRLDSLDIDLDDVDTADVLCRNFLSGDTLERHGTIFTLHIITKSFSTPLFDTIRALSPLMAPYAGFGGRLEVSSRSRYDEYVGDMKEQFNYLSYLRKQPFERRKYLSTIDFQSLGLTKLSEVETLTYDANGRPRSRIEEKAEKLVESIQTGIGALPLSTLLSLIEAGIPKSVSAANHLAAMSPNATDAEMLGEAEKLQAALNQVQSAALRIVGAVSRETHKGVADLIKELKGRL